MKSTIVFLNMVWSIVTKVRPTWGVELPQHSLRGGGVLYLREDRDLGKVQLYGIKIMCSTVTRWVHMKT